MKTFLALLMGLMLTPAMAGASGTCDTSDDNKCEAWTDVWDSGNNGDWWERSVVVEESPDARVIVVSGTSYIAEHQDSDILTIAYEARTGRRLWVRRFAGPEGETEWPADVVFDPDGETVYVPGFHNPGTTNNRWRILAYRVATGKLLWSARGVKRKGYPVAADISGSGKTLYVTGTSHESKKRKRDIATVAFDTSDGDVRWRESYNGEMSRRDEGEAIFLDGFNDRLYVSGASEGGEAIRDKDAVTLRYDLRGKQGPELVWDRVTHSNPRWFNYGGVEMELAPDGGTVYLVKAHARRSETALIDTTYDWRYETVALDSGDGSTRWNVIETAETTPWPSVPELVADPAGDFVFVSGLPKTGGGFEYVVTKAYEAGTGTTLWTAEHQGPTGTFSVELDTGPTGSGLYLFAVDMKAGFGRDFRTIKYDVGDGDVLWTAAFNTATDGSDETNADDGFVGGDGWIYVTGSTSRGNESYATIAYRDID